LKHAVIFDIDGTLLESFEQDDRIYREAVRRILGDVVLRAELTGYDQVTDSGILQQIFADNKLPEDPKTIDEVKGEFFSQLASFIGKSGPFGETPGAKSVLQRLQASESHVVAIATGGWCESARMKLATAEFDIETIPLATSDDAVARTEIMQFALSQIGEKFDSITYFGDGVWDEQACDILGWSFRPVGPALGGIKSFDGEYAIK